MVYCVQCGSVVEGRFCQKCGTAAAQADAPLAPPAAPGAAPVAQKRSPLVWVLVGCAGLIVIAGVITLSLGLFVAHKARQAGIDPDMMKRNPAMAVTKMLTALNPDVEVVSVNEDKGIITVREKSTGKTLTMNFEDVKKGKIVFTDEHGEEVAVQSQGEGGSGSFTVKSKDGLVKAGAKWTPPGWLPVYSGARIENGVNSQSPEEEAGAGYLSTTDSIEEALNFYEKALRNGGFEVSRQMTSPDGKNNVGTLTGQSDGGKRYVNVIVMRADDVTRINLTYTIKK